MDIFDLSGERLRDLRDQLGLTRDQLAEKSGVPARTIQDIETGKIKNPGIETLKPLLIALGANNKRKTELVFAIITLLPALDNGQLSDILGQIQAASLLNTPAMKTK